MLRIHDSALKHGCTREAISHAYDLFLYEGDLDDDPPKVLVVGPDPGGNLPELIGAESADGDMHIWHAMRCRQQYLDLLPKTGGTP